jgi:recombination protein RecR
LIDISETVAPFANIGDEDIMRLPEVVENAVNALTRLPGIGERSAYRIVFWLIGRPADQLEALAEAIRNLADSVIICSVCGNISDRDPCDVCSDMQRNRQKVCVVQETSDMLAIEKSGAYSGLYHILGGAIDPINDIHPDDLNIDSLIERVSVNKFDEIILATDPNAEGNITATYIRQKLDGIDIKITRIAQGIAYGSGISYSNERTLKEAFDNRIESKNA